MLQPALIYRKYKKTKFPPSYFQSYIFRHQFSGKEKRTQEYVSLYL